MVTTLYRARRLWTGRDDTVVSDGAVLVGGENILAAGRFGDIPADAVASATTVDLGDTTLLPGLIDAHVHLQFPLRGRGDFLLSLVEPIEFTVLKAARNAQVYLAAGFTTVFDCGSRGDLAVCLREAIDCGLCVGPRVVACGLPLSPTGGWVDEYAPFIHNAQPQGQVADTPDEWTRAVRRQAKQGVDSIKIGVSGSSLNPYSRSDTVDMSRAEIAHVVDIAHRARVRVAVHCDPAEGLKSSIAAGADTIHHGKGMDDECRRLLRDSNCYYVPTAMKYQGLVDDGERFGRPPEAVARLRAGLERFREGVAATIAGGLADRIAVGSDAGNLPPGHGTTAREVELLTELGMSPFQAMRSATSVAARAVGRESIVGSLEPGLRADFIAVDGNPFDDVRLLQDRGRIAAVFKDGHRVAERGRIVATPDLVTDPPNTPLFARH